MLERNSTFLLNNMFIPSPDNCNTRSLMALDIPLCRTNKEHKRMSFLGSKIFNNVSTNVKAAATTASFMHVLQT